MVWSDGWKSRRPNSPAKKPVALVVLEAMIGTPMLSSFFKMTATSVRFWRKKIKNKKSEASRASNSARVLRHPTYGRRLPYTALSDNLSQTPAGRVAYLQAWSCFYSQDRRRTRGENYKLTLDASIFKVSSSPWWACDFMAGQWKTEVDLGVKFQILEIGFGRN